MQSIRASVLQIPFNTAFKHASAERSASQTLWIEARSHDGVSGYGEGCPREYVTGENLVGAREFVSKHTDQWLQSIGDVDSITDWATHHGDQIDRNPSAWCAVELALLDLFGKCANQSVEALLGVAELDGSFRYSAVLGDAPPPQFAKQLAHYVKAGFSDFKVKLSGDHARDTAKVNALRSAGIASSSVRADANNLWSDAAAATAAIESLDFTFWAVEEPLRSGDYDGLSELARAIDTKIILDESLAREDQLPQIEAFADRCIVNLRVSKMGGVLRSLQLARALRRREMKLIIGAHVGETSLLTRAALTVANCSRDILLAQEGAFGTHLLAHDVVDSPIMFGAGGVLDAATISSASGFGLACGVTSR